MKCTKMPGQITPYRPQNVADDKVLCVNLRTQGAKVAEKRLNKTKKGTFPSNGSPAERSEWWNNLKEGEKKAKQAMAIMASEYDPAIKRLDRCERKLLGLETKMKSQEEEIDSLKIKLRKQEEENKQLRDAIAEAQASQRLKNEETNLLRQRVKSDDEEIQSLRLQLRSVNEEVESLRQLKYPGTSQDIVVRNQTSPHNSRDVARSGQPVVLVSPDQTQLLHPIKLLEALPDLEMHNSNHEFWKKIKEWIAVGVPPQQVFSLIKAKCPSEIWKVVVKDINENDFQEIDFYNSAQVERLLCKLRKSMSEALGSGIKLYSLYSCRLQKEDESFEDYIKDKFRLYCSYGHDVDNKDPDVNDQLFLFNALNDATKEYQEFNKFQYPTSYEDMMNRAAALESYKLDAQRRNECVNCGKSGHTKARCRRPGGGAEAGPNECFRCGIRGHRERNCRK
ncbi:uncharacterized protein LOC118803870 [Colossoma macropomum]|uniref:uncharacterized protein LOC118803870 n=1 Tax=Colossoma macropomum TaxID=42526 RepID=UPI0018654F63|nr:uncharacterized protein LOC118803870 [Colossoma macropomum]XP_036420291.1 uncharacterized protein LOC118803870 [Colossoma macropomum]XP_036420292.1 uncharacterized protein LOC118803870 [Colossoma macropomum]XP_036420293.1 uncharacterized protein LOC118803870 [Colossoma macropomum]XP_036420294.1 uncharacterized protein LOC118803870 [Colossoma macropomum]